MQKEIIENARLFVYDMLRFAFWRLIFYEGFF